MKITRKKCFNRGPRIPFSGEQICILENKFRQNQYLSSYEVVDLSETLNLTEARVSEIEFLILTMDRLPDVSDVRGLEGSHKIIGKQCLQIDMFNHVISIGVTPNCLVS